MVTKPDMLLVPPYFRPRSAQELRPFSSICSVACAIWDRAQVLVFAVGELRSCDATLHNLAEQEASIRRNISNKRMKLAVLLKILEGQLAEKQEQFIQLEREHQRLQHEHALLVGCCDGLQLLRLQHVDEDASQSAEAVVEPHPFSQEELQLLQQLANIPYSNSPSADDIIDGGAGGISSCMRPTSTSSNTDQQGGQQQLPGKQAANAAVDPTKEQLSPPDDPMHYFRYLTSLPFLRVSPQLTAADLTVDYSRTVHEIALQLHLVKPPVSAVLPGQEDHWKKLKWAIDRHMHLLSTLLLQQRSDIIETFGLTNFETFEFREEVDHGKHVSALAQLGLSDQQKASIAHGMALFGRLLAPIIQERQQLQQRVAGGSEAAGGQAVNRKQQLHLQGVQVDRLTMLLGKEYILRYAAVAWIAGCFTYFQLATVAVLLTPWPPCLLRLGRLVAAEVQQQQQLEQQRQQAEQQQQKQRKQLKAKHRKSKAVQ